MAKKRYSFIVEKVYSTEVEGEFDLDAIRKNNERIAHWSDEEILIHMSEAYGTYDEMCGAKYELEAINVRSIYNVDDEEVVYEDL
jgi:hypothetical protein